MESRLDVLLFRLNLVTSVRMARQFILHGKVLVNGKIIKTPGYNLKENEILTVIPSLLSKIKTNLLEKISNGNFLIFHIHLNYIECL
jgi:small subunit ribosomal protein S4